MKFGYVSHSENYRVSNKAARNWSCVLHGHHPEQLSSRRVWKCWVLIGVKKIQPSKTRFSSFRRTVFFTVQSLWCIELRQDRLTELQRVSEISGWIICGQHDDREKLSENFKNRASGTKFSHLSAPKIFTPPLAETEQVSSRCVCNPKNQLRAA